MSGISTETPPSSTSPSDARADALRGFGPIGLLAIVVVLSGTLVSPVAAALLALGWARLSRTPLAELGFVRPKSWAFDVVVGTLLGAGLKLMMKAVVMPLLGAPQNNPRYAFLAGDPVAVAWMVVVIFVVAGFGEETLNRGYLFERLRRLLGDGVAARVLIVTATTLLFGISHYADQGMPGVQQATIVGAVYGALYAITRRIGLVMIVHVVFDLVAVWIIYARLETTVARWVFR